MTDGINHQSVRMIHDSQVHPGSAAVADVLREALLGAYVHEIHNYAQLATQVYVDHPESYNIGHVVESTVPLGVALFVCYLPVGLRKIVAEVTFLTSFEDNVVGRVRLRLSDSMTSSAQFNPGYESPVTATELESGEGGGILRARGVYDASVTGTTPIDGGAVNIEVRFCATDNSDTIKAVPARPLSVSLWTEPV